MSAAPAKGRLKPVDPLADRPLWGLWRELMALYPLWRSVLSAMNPRSAFRRENSYFWFDVIRGLRSMSSSLRVAERLESVGDSDLDGLIALAEVNSRRQEHFFRTLVLSYVTVPFTIGAIWAQLMPGQLISLVKEPDLAPVWGGTIAGLATALAVRFIADWRARSFLAVLQMARIERSAAALTMSPVTLAGSRSPAPASGRA